MGSTLNAKFREVVMLGSYNGIIAWVIDWDPNKVIDIGQWSICGSAQLERFYWIYLYLACILLWN